MKHRLFLAIELPQDSWTRVQRIQSDLLQSGLPLHLVPPEKLHLTLNFLGKVESERISGICKRIESVANRNKRFFLKPMFLEYLYKRHEPSFIYLSPGGDLEQLKTLQAELTLEMGKLQLPVQNRFLPHIKLAELQKSDPVTVKSQLGQLSSIVFTPMAKFRVDHISLYQSFVSKYGSTFQLVSKFPLIEK